MVVAPPSPSPGGSSNRLIFSWILGACILSVGNFESCWRLVLRVIRDYIGKRGERIFEVLILDPCGRQNPFFDPVYLGDKFPTLDYYVELVGAGARYYFLVQIKSTREGYRALGGRRRLRVELNQKDIDRMVAFPAPTYAVGIDEGARRGYILSVNAARRGISTFPTKFPLSCANLRRLWNEVNTFWSRRDMALTGSYFIVE